MDILTDPLSVWMKMERCTFLVGCTSNYNAYDRDNSDNDSDTSNETTNDGGDNDNCDDLNGKQPNKAKYTGCDYFALSLSVRT